MARKRYSVEEIIEHLGTIEIETGEGVVVVEACRKLGITEETCYRRKRRYAGLQSEQVRQLSSPNANLLAPPLRTWRIGYDRASISLRTPLPLPGPGIHAPQWRILVLLGC